MKYPKTLQDLIESYNRLPGIGEKTAERLALASLNLDQETIEMFSSSLSNLKTKIKKCKTCNGLSEEDECSICLDNNRDDKKICVVENAKNIIMFEKTGIYDGKYFVMNKLISPLQGINPGDTNINELINLVKEKSIKEIIIAIRPSIEGETTALYISKLLEDTEVIVSKIAHGIPMGVDMDYLDSMTLEFAFEDRKKIDKF